MKPKPTPSSCFGSGADWTVHGRLAGTPHRPDRQACRRGKWVSCPGPSEKGPPQLGPHHKISIGPQNLVLVTLHVLSWGPFQLILSCAQQNLSAALPTGSVAISLCISKSWSWLLHLFIILSKHNKKERPRESLQYHVSA